MPEAGRLHGSDRDCQPPGHCFGWWVNHKGVWIDGDGRGYAGMSFRKIDGHLQALMLQSMAGRLAEHRWHGCDFANDHDDILEEIRTCGVTAFDGSDAFEEVQALLADDPEISTETLLTAVACYRHETERLLAEPDIWGDIERLVKALVAHGELTSDQVDELLDGISGCRGFNSLTFHQATKRTRG